MIEKMKMVYIVTTVSHKDDMLRELRKLGLMHIAERKPAGQASVARFTELSKTAARLREFAPDPKKDKNKKEAPAVLSDEAFESMYAEVKDALERKDRLSSVISTDVTEIARIEPWGNFSPTAVKTLRQVGYDLHFYTMGVKEADQIFADDKIRAIRLAPVEKQAALAVVGELPTGFPAKEFVLPKRSLNELLQKLQDCTSQEENCEKILSKDSLYENSFQDQMLKAQNAENYSSARETVKTEESLIWIRGYVPEVEVETFKEAASGNGWAYAIDDVADDDEHIPTKLRYNKVTKIIEPLYNILGILPGYREVDISLWFLLFFTLFVAMIMGDGGYGLVFLAVTILLFVKKRKMTTPLYLLLVLSIGTIVWGAITGTWFGMESAMKVPFLKALVLPGFANYPQYFDVTAAAQQDNIMKFSFTIGAIQMELGSLLAIKKKITEKNLSFLADAGWMITICAMYLLALYLVIGEKMAIKPIFVAVGIGFVLVILFGGFSTGDSIGKGILSSLGGAFTAFLDTISCFGNVMSYIRLFAVGMAGLAIAQSFNGMAAGVAHGPLIIAAAIIAILGHALNIVMCILSVVVHGVRLNVLEFSGQVGLEWTGIPYEPFRVEDRIKN